MEVRSVRYDEARPLVEALNEELTLRYGGGPASVAHPEDFLPPYGTFLVGAHEGEDLACGGVRLLDPVHGELLGEVKRMYVVPAARGRGFARELLRALVQHARDVGLREVWLETGTAQPEAIALYESENFTPIPRYGQYRDEPDSRCFRLSLQQPA